MIIIAIFQELDDAFTSLDQELGGKSWQVTGETQTGTGTKSKAGNGRKNKLGFIFNFWDKTKWDKKCIRQSQRFEKKLFCIGDKFI